MVRDKEKKFLKSFFMFLTSWEKVVIINNMGTKIKDTMEKRGEEL